MGVVKNAPRSALGLLLDTSGGDGCGHCGVESTTSQRRFEHHILKDVFRRVIL